LNQFVISLIGSWNAGVSRALYYCKACHGYSNDIKIIKKCRCKAS